MRVRQDSQLKCGQVAIADITFDPTDRDDIPAVLMGLQALHGDDETRTKIFDILETRLLPNTRLNRGRPGMELWRIFVLGVVKLALDCDFDRLRYHANHDVLLRKMLGHTDFLDEDPYQLQTIIDNVTLLTEEVLIEINAAVVACGHKQLNHAPDAPLACRVDSAVTKTNVHWPTDVNLLWDAMRCLLRTLHRVCAAHDVSGWRKSAYWTQQVKHAFYHVRTARLARSTEKVKAYLALCRRLVARAEVTLAELQKRGTATDKITDYRAHALRQIDQVERRLVHNEKIPHHEKVLSIYEMHTRWNNKGKVGVMAELGLPVCFIEDQHQFILWHHVLHHGGDADMIVGFLKEVKRRYPSLVSCSMDRGYYTPDNRKALDEVLALNAMPRKGRGTLEDRARERAPAFAKARRHHPGIESAINNLNHRGLARIRTHGVDGFVRTVALGVVAANVHRLGQIVKKQAIQHLQWHKARRKAA